MFEFFFKYSIDDYLRSDLVWLADWPAWVVFGVSALCVTAVAFVLGRQFRRRPMIQLIALGCLQLMLLGLLVAVLFQPSLKTEQLKAGENTVALLLDHSESMSIGETNPLDLAREALDELSLQGATEFDSLRYTFGSNLTSVDDFSAVAAVAQASDLSGALTRVLAQARERALAGVVVATDGAQTNGLSDESLASIASFGVPVYPVSVGSDVLPNDVQVDRVLLPAKAPRDSTVTARVSIRHDQAADAQLKVYSGDELLANKPVQLSGDVGATTVDVELPLSSVGNYSLRFLVDPDLGDIEPKNNVYNTAVSVVEQSFDVLYFEGEPRWEYKFLRRALETEANLRLVSLLRVSENKFYRQGLVTPEQLENGFPTTRAELFAFDAVIIGSVEAALLTEEQQENLGAFVSQRGGALLLIAGPRGLGNGGWGQSALADVLPVTLPSSTVDSFVRDRVSVFLTRAGQASPSFRLAEAQPESEEIWESLPEVANYQRLSRLKPAATAWLEMQTVEGPLPLLVSQPFGRGKSLVLATAGTWRWQMGLPFEDLSHERFWQQLLRFMVSDVQGRNTLVVDQDTNKGSLSLSARFHDQEFQGVSDLSVSVLATNDDGQSQQLTMVPSPVSPGVFNTEAKFDTAGVWYFEVMAEKDGEPWAEMERSHFVGGQSSEAFHLRQQRGLLERIAEATGGQVFDANQPLEILERVKYSKAGVSEFRYRSIWDAPIFFLMIVALKLFEWLLRRRWSSI